MLLTFAAGCKKKAPAPPPPPPPPPPAKMVEKVTPKAPVIVQFTAEPGSIERGQSATLRWSVNDATSVRIEPGLGDVNTNGNRAVYPSSSTTYKLTATGPGGSADATASVNVTVPETAPPPPPPAKDDAITRLTRDVQDIFFDYDKSDVREDARGTMSRNAEALKGIMRDFPSFTVVLEGHCDERGSAEYNLGLGDRRSTSAKDFLVGLGVPGDRLKTISYGKERPQCTDANDGCYQKNRRAHFSAGQ